jgi:hypothetical protein
MRNSEPELDQRLKRYKVVVPRGEALPSPFRPGLPFDVVASGCGHDGSDASAPVGIEVKNRDD